MNKQLRRVLVIDDDESMRHMVRLVLEREGYLVAETTTGIQGLDLLQSDPYPLVLCDIRMPEMDGLTFLREKARRRLDGTVIMMSAYGNIDTAIDCMKQGAYDYISKPFRPDEILLTIRKAEERMLLHQENVTLKQRINREARPQGLASIVHESKVMDDVIDTLKKTAVSSASVLITGETGTGKELVARALHAESQRADRPFLAVNCSALPEGLLESELFGHAKGAFTGADRAREGLFGAADGGTLLLDEISDMPLALQPKLLRVLQEHEVRKVGETKPHTVDVRVLAATAADLQEAVAEGRFREDLYYRLAVVTIHLPALHQRRQDIAPLVRHFLPNLAARLKRPTPTLTDQAMQLLEGQHWPGNIRELQNVLEKSMVLSRADVLDVDDLILGERRVQTSEPTELSLKKAMAKLEREYITRALDATGGNRTQAAKVLEISLRSLIYKIKEYEIDK